MDQVHFNVLLNAVFIMISIPVCAIDIRHRRIPDWAVLPGIGVFFILRVFIAGDYPVIVFWEMSAGAIIFSVVYMITRGKLGVGDIKFAALMGIFTGFPGWFYAVATASVLGLIIAAGGWLLGYLNRESKIPFAPFLVAGSLGAYYFMSFISG